MAKIRGNSGEYTDFPIDEDKCLVITIDGMYYAYHSISTRDIGSSISYKTRGLRFKKDTPTAAEWWFEDAALDDKVVDLLERVSHEKLSIKVAIGIAPTGVDHHNKLRLLAFGVEAWYGGKDVTTNPDTGEIGMYKLATRLSHVKEKLA